MSLFGIDDYLALKSISEISVSPDGQYVAYTSNDSGRDEVYIKRFPSGEGRWQASMHSISPIAAFPGRPSC